MLTKEGKQARVQARREAREQAKAWARYEAERNQKPVRQLTITIEWTKSRTWGAIPHAMVEVEYKDGKIVRRNGYTRSGCDCDKESTVIAQVFNDFLKYKLYQDIPDKPYGISEGNLNGVPYIHYNGRVGASYYYKIALAIGGMFKRLASGKAFDVFVYKDNE